MESRSCVFTNFDIDHTRTLSKLATLQATYFVFGNEICPTTGKAHLQGFAQFGKKHTIKKIRKIMECHCEVPVRSPEECIAYCKKAGDFREEGTPRGISKGNAQKDRWKQLLSLAKSGCWTEIEESFPSAAILHRKTLKSIMEENIQPSHHPERKCVWIWGHSGVGKSRWVHSNYSEDKIFTLSDTDGWDLYNQESVALLDEADESLALNWKRLLRWSDRYPIRARRLYGTVPLNYTTLVVTSMKNPSDFFTNEKWDAIRRRFIIVEAVKYDESKDDLIIKDNQPFPLYLRTYLFKYDIIF